MTSTLRIGLILPDVMGTYGDGGNALVLRERARQRGFKAEIITITIHDAVPEDLDIYTLGGAEDSAQRLAFKHLQKYPGLQKAIAANKPALAVCAAIQVLGQWWQTSEGNRQEGLGIFDLYTVPMEQRAIGEVITQPSDPELTELLTGFENHRGASILGSSAKPLAQTKHGVGNAYLKDMSNDRSEGIIQGNAIGTYLHGPVLARNPQLADVLLSKALGIPLPSLAPIDDSAIDLLRSERIRIGSKRSENAKRALKNSIG